MFKIIWSQDSAGQLKSLLNGKTLDEAFVVAGDLSEIPADKIGIVCRDDQLEKIQSLLEKIRREEAQLLFETRDGWIQLPISEITFLESFGNEVHIHLVNQSTKVVAEPMYQLEQVLQPYHFIRVGKSFIVSIRKIRYIRTGWNAKLDLELTNGVHLEVTRSYVKSFKEALKIT